MKLLGLSLFFTLFVSNLSFASGTSGNEFLAKCRRFVFDIARGEELTLTRNALNIDASFPVTPQPKGKVPHPTVEGASVYRLTPEDFDKLKPGTKLVNSITGRETILGLDPVDLSKIGSDGLLSYGLSTTTGEQNLLANSEITRRHNNFRVDGKGRTFNELSFDSRYMTPKMSDRARYLLNLAYSGYSASGGAARIEIGNSGVLTYQQASGRAEVFLPNGEARKETRQRLHSFATENGYDIKYYNIETRDFTKLDYDPKNDQMFVTLDSPEAVEKFLEFEVQQRGGEEKLLDNKADSYSRRQVLQTN